MLNWSNITRMLLLPITFNSQMIPVYTMTAVNPLIMGTLFWTGFHVATASWTRPIVVLTIFHSSGTKKAQYWLKARGWFWTVPLIENYTFQRH